MKQRMGGHPAHLPAGQHGKTTRLISVADLDAVRAEVTGGEKLARGTGLDS
jgi:hypothetical protein